jgi:hypothetical protein
VSTVVIHAGPSDEALALTSLVSGLHRQYGVHPITWVTNPENMVFYRHLKGVQVCEMDCPPLMGQFDRMINLGGSAAALGLSTLLNASQCFGLYSNETPFASENAHDARHAFEVLYEGKETKQNHFQVLFQMAGLSWRGESYAFRYYPKAKEKRDTTGIAVRHDATRQFLKDQLHLDCERLWHIPIKRDPLKQFDEVNRCESVITDDPFVMHVAVALRKHVEFLLHRVPTTRIELFGRGSCHLVPDFLKGPVSSSSEEGHKETPCPSCTA